MATAAPPPGRDGHPAAPVSTAAPTDGSTPNPGQANFAGRTVAPADAGATATGGPGSTSGATGANLGDRNVTVQGNPASFRHPLSDRFPLGQPVPVRLPEGAEVTVERINDGGGPTDLDGRVADILSKERSGDIDGAKKSFWEKAASVASTAMDFVMHNKKFQTGVGLIGIFACIGVGCVFPVALVGAGPFIIMFANGFIDNPMLADNPGQPPGSSPPAITPPPDSTGTGSSKKPDDDDPNKKPPALPVGGGPTSGGASAVPPPPAPPPPVRNEPEDPNEAFIRRNALANAAAARTNAGGTPQPVVASVIPSTGDPNEDMANAYRFAAGSPAGAGLSRAIDFDLATYLGDGGEVALRYPNLTPGHRDEIQREITRWVLPNYHLDRVPMNGMDDNEHPMGGALTQAESEALKQLITQAVADEYVQHYVESLRRGENPAPRNMRRQALPNAGARLGIDRIEHDQAAVINQYFEPRVRRTISNWFYQRLVPGARS